MSIYLFNIDQLEEPTTNIVWINRSSLKFENWLGIK